MVPLRFFLSHRLLAPIVAALCLLGARIGAAGVLVVDPNGAPGTYPTIQAAVDAAASGDIVLVRGGSYAGVTIDGKALDLAADTALPRPKIHGPIRIQNLSSAARVAVRGFDVFGKNSEALIVFSCLGTVFVEDCLLRGSKGVNTFSSPQYHPDGYAGVRAQSAAGLVLVRCEIEGGVGPDLDNENTQFLPGNGGDAVYAEASGLALFESALTGGPGGDDLDDHQWGGDGGHGLHLVTAAHAHLEACSLTGGDGGDGGFEVFSGCGNGGDGGHGLFIPLPAPPTSSRGSVFQGGKGGLGGLGCPNGADGLPVSAPAGAFQLLPGEPRHLEVSSPAREQGTVLLDLAGHGGDAVVLFVDLSFGLLVQTPYPGALVVSPFPFRAVVLPPLPPSGQWTIQATVPNLPPGVQGATLTLQAVLGDPTHSWQAVLSAPSRLLLLDASL